MEKLPEGLEIYCSAINEQVPYDLTHEEVFGIKINVYRCSQRQDCAKSCPLEGFIPIPICKSGLEYDLAGEEDDHITQEHIGTE